MGGSGGLLGGVTSFLFGDGGASEQAAAADRATAASAQATADSLALQRYMYEDTKAANKPYADMALSALTTAFGTKNADGTYSFDPTKLNQYTVNTPFQYQDFNPNIDITQDPSYQFRLGQGVNALDKSAAARGNLLSGAQQKAVQQYGQDLASQEYGNAWNRALGAYQQNQGNALTSYNSNVNLGNQRYNQIASMLGMGQTSVNNLTQNNTNMAQLGTSTNMQNAQNIGSAAAYAGNAAAQGQQYGTNALLNAASLGLGAYKLLSDRRLKTNIVKIGQLENGLNVYEYDYIWGEHAIGVIAQEVLSIKPDAVFVVGNFYGVDYSKLGV